MSFIFRILTIVGLLFIFSCEDEGALVSDAGGSGDDDGDNFIYGCTDEESVNYSPNATSDDGFCKGIEGTWKVI